MASRSRLEADMFMAVKSRPFEQQAQRLLLSIFPERLFWHSFILFRGLYITKLAQFVKFVSIENHSL
jgi:hypothetical protein